jgi:hypothetical protein
MGWLIDFSFLSAKGIADFRKKAKFISRIDLNI